MAWQLAVKDRTTKALKMKNKLKISTLIFGIIIAVVALSNSNTYAGNNERSDVTELKALEIEMLEVIEQILEKDEVQLVKDKCLKIYNSKSQLVYECRDKNDERLKILLRRCDLVLHTDSSSYYLLGD